MKKTSSFGEYLFAIDIVYFMCLVFVLTSTCPRLSASRNKDKWRADVLVGNTKYEFKSWTPGNPNPWNAFFNGSGNSYTQFLRYLENTDNINELKYIFNAQKTDVGQVKNAFKELFQVKKNEIFELIWKNQNLRDSLFDLSKYPSNLNQNQLKQLVISDFDVLITNNQGTLYQFIKSQ